MGDPIIEIAAPIASSVSAVVGTLAILWPQLRAAQADARDARDRTIKLEERLSGHGDRLSDLSGKVATEQGARHAFQKEHGTWLQRFAEVFGDVRQTIGILEERSRHERTKTD